MPVSRQKISPRLSWISACASAALIAVIALPGQADVGRIQVELPDETASQTGRLFVVFSKDTTTEPRLNIADDPAPRQASPFFAVDVSDWNGDPIEFEPTAGFPIESLDELERGTWQVQALLDTNQILSNLNSPGNLYSQPQTVQLDGGTSNLRFSLTEAVPREQLPADTELLKFVRIRSDLLSQFYDQDMYLRASVLLPPGYEQGSGERYPVLFQVAGLNGRYTRSQRLLNNDEFMEYWMADDTPPAVIVFLDGESPYGDSYQMNSAVSGPYADANFTELFPYLAEQFPIEDIPTSRFVTGCSTGGWVSMALQILYPDYFNGAYSLSPDSPSFRAFQLVNLYDDDNAFFSASGIVRPSARGTNGDPRFTILDEVHQEAVMGRGGSFVNSGAQWGSWNAVYGTPDENGDPIPVWDQQSGEINPAVAESWTPWDLDFYVRDNWSQIGEDLSGKLQFWMGDMDNYYLTNGLRFLEETLNLQEAPAANASFTWLPYHGHCGFGTQVHYIDVLEDMALRAAGG